MLYIQLIVMTRRCVIPVEVSYTTFKLCLTIHNVTLHSIYAAGANLGLGRLGSCLER
jgi:hypothetical protein